MRRAPTLVFRLLALSVSQMAQMRFQAPPPPSAKLIRAGRVLDVRNGRYLLDQGILTEGEKIKGIGPWADVKPRAPSDIVMIDLSQLPCCPG